MRRWVLIVATTPRSVAALVLIAHLLSATSVYAFSFGITGFSGEQGPTCGSCHGGGNAPTVSFGGPATLAPGSTGTYAFTVHSNAARQVAAGFNVAASGGSLQVVSGQPERLIGRELTHMAPQTNDKNNNASWTFAWQAPATPGDYILFGAGNSVNLSGTPVGDQAVATSFVVSVSSGPSSTSTPTPTATPVPDTVATPTPPFTCSGDCNDDGSVTVDEILILVNIGFGAADLSTCRAGDANGDGTITINEILGAVKNALDGCPGM